MSKILIDAGPSARGFHRLEAALRCGQLYSWGYGRGNGSNDPKFRERFPPTEPLVRGSIGHVGIAHLYQRVKCIQRGEDYSSYYSPADAMALSASSFGDLGDEMLGVALTAVKRYSEHYGVESFEVVSVEEEIETEFLGYRYTARADLTVKDLAGKTWLYDHKFVNKIESKVYRRYILSGQFLGLIHLGTRLYGSDFGGIRLNLVGVRDGKFERVTPEPAPWMLERFPHVVKHAEELIARIESLESQGIAVPASPSEHTCWGSYGECPAFEFCRWGDRIPLLTTMIDSI